MVTNTFMGTDQCRFFLQVEAPGIDQQITKPLQLPSLLAARLLVRDPLAPPT